MAGIITLANNTGNDEIFYQYDRGKIINVDLRYLNEANNIGDSEEEVIIPSENSVTIVRVECAPVIDGIEMNAKPATYIDQYVVDREYVVNQYLVPKEVLTQFGELNIYILVRKTTEVENENAPTWVIDKQTFSIQQRSMPIYLVTESGGIEQSTPVTDESILNSLSADRAYSYRGMTSGIFPLTKEGQKENWIEGDVLLDVLNNHLYIYINIDKNGTNYQWLDIGDLWYGDRQGKLHFYTGTTWITTKFIYSAEQAEEMVQEIYSFEGSVTNVNELNKIGEQYIDTSINNPYEHPSSYIGETRMVTEENNSLFTWSRFEGISLDAEDQPIHPQNQDIKVYPFTENDITKYYTWVQINSSDADISQKISSYIDNTSKGTGDLAGAIKDTSDGKIPSSALINNIVKLINDNKLNVTEFLSTLKQYIDITNNINEEGYIKDQSEEKIPSSALINKLFENFDADKLSIEKFLEKLKTYIDTEATKDFQTIITDATNEKIPSSLLINTIVKAIDDKKLDIESFLTEFKKYIDTYENLSENKELVSPSNDKVASTLLINEMFNDIKNKKLDTTIFNDFLKTNRFKILEIANDDEQTIINKSSEIIESGVYLLRKPKDNLNILPNENGEINWDKTIYNGAILLVITKEGLGKIGEFDSIRRDTYQIIIYNPIIENDNNKNKLKIKIRYENSNYFTSNGYDYNWGGSGWHDIKTFFVDSLLTTDNIVNNIYEAVDEENSVPNLKAIYEVIKNNVTYKGDKMYSELESVKQTAQVGDVYKLVNSEDNSDYLALFFKNTDSVMDYKLIPLKERIYSKADIDNKLKDKQDILKFDPTNVLYDTNGVLIKTLANNIEKFNDNLKYLGDLPNNEGLLNWSKNETERQYKFWSQVVSQEDAKEGKSAILFYIFDKLTYDNNGAVTGVATRPLAISDLVRDSGQVIKDENQFVTGAAVYDFVEQSKQYHLHYRGEVSQLDDLFNKGAEQNIWPDDAHAGDIWCVNNENFKQYYMWDGIATSTDNMEYLFSDMINTNIPIQYDSYKNASSGLIYEIIEELVNAAVIPGYNLVFRGYSESIPQTGEKGDVYWTIEDENPGYHLIVRTNAGNNFTDFNQLIEEQQLIKPILIDTDLDNIKTSGIYTLPKGRIYNSPSPISGASTIMLVFSKTTTTYQTIYGEDGQVYTRQISTPGGTADLNQKWTSWERGYGIKDLNGSAIDCTITGHYHVNCTDSNYQEKDLPVPGTYILQVQKERGVVKQIIELGDNIYYRSYDPSLQYWLPWSAYHREKALLEGQSLNKIFEPGDYYCVNPTDGPSDLSVFKLTISRGIGNEDNDFMAKFTQCIHYGGKYYYREMQEEVRAVNNHSQFTWTDPWIEIDFSSLIPTLGG